MDPSAQILLTLGGILLLGLATDILGQRTFLPRVTLMLLFGMLIGPGMLDLIPAVQGDPETLYPETIEFLSLRPGTNWMHLQSDFSWRKR